MVTPVIDESQAQHLVERVRTGLGDVGQKLTEKRMFGGTTFLLNGNMLCCVSKSGLMVRIGAEAEPDALARPFTQPCLGAGRRMAGFISVAFDGLATEPSLRSWLAMARNYVEPMPMKGVATHISADPPAHKKSRPRSVNATNRKAT